MSLASSPWRENRQYTADTQLPSRRGGFRLDQQEDFPKAKGTRRKMVSTERSYSLAQAWEVGVEHRLS